MNSTAKPNSPRTFPYSQLSVHEYVECSGFHYTWLLSLLSLLSLLCLLQGAVLVMPSHPSHPVSTSKRHHHLALTTMRTSSLSQAVIPSALHREGGGEVSPDPADHVVAVSPSVILVVLLRFIPTMSTQVAVVVEQLVIRGCIKTSRTESCFGRGRRKAVAIILSGSLCVRLRKWGQPAWRHA